ncbi:nuclear RNA export factor 2-like isoform X1 [Dipodomys merriami]|uniref:nuclear RNA export factor 2-like isoform X1 n=1 Tax=Dipodomys merriami TaxID=94247 RepID=UPI0038559F72
MSSNLRKYGAKRDEGYRNSSHFSGGRSGSASNGNFRRRNGHHTGYDSPASKLQNDDGNVDMFQSPNDPQSRRPPYANQQNRWRSNWHNGDQLDNAAGKDRQPGEGAMQQDMVKGAMQDWFMVKIPCGRRYDKTWLMNSIQSYCSVPFTPVDFHYDRSWAQFFVEGASVAEALREICYKIRGEKSQKVSLFVCPSFVPYSVRYKFTDEQIEQIKLTMKKRYDIEEQALDLQKLRFDPDLMDHDIDFVLNRRHCLTIAVQIIQNSFPELSYLNLSNNKLYRLDALCDIVDSGPEIRILDLSRNQLRSVLELNKVKGLKLDELWLEGNPLCRTFQDQSAYQRAIHNYFPQLLWLDGQQFNPPIAPGTDARWLMNPSRQEDEDEDLRERVLQFLKKYYSVYDSGDRQNLLGAYHDEACFSVSVPASAGNPGPSCLSLYFKHSRNLNTLKDPYVQQKLLKHRKQDIVDSLCLLPKTQHDLSSFMIDMCFQTEKMICFSVNGLFREEAGGNSQDSIRAFTRTFIAIPGSGTNLCIMNDQLFVRDTTSEEVSGTIASLVGPSPRPTLSQVQCEMVQTFSIQSGMKLDWSEKCLMDNAWDYNRAAQIFIKFQNEGKIPQEAFKPKP